MLRGLLLTVVVVSITGLAAVFAALNPGRMVVDFAFGTVEVERSLALIAALLAGWVLGLLSVAAAVRRFRRERSQLQRALRLAEQEVEALRSIPVQDAD
jgi:uncharacterized integral membrane protein